ncbi:hypothetical protein EDC01DRAFT_780323 [Geopyxis carbonaria]|nr:hypothetical protein EDC01DRAFT_780323 [Geopyxis carbonaria]
MITAPTPLSQVLALMGLIGVFILLFCDLDLSSYLSSSTAPLLHDSKHVDDEYDNESDYFRVEMGADGGLFIKNEGEDEIFRL